MEPKKLEIAQESDKTKKARAKLQKKLLALDEKITDGALDKKLKEIHQWISHNASSRVVLKEKGVALFDENQNVAKLSARVQEIAKFIRSEMEK